MSPGKETSVSNEQAPKMWARRGDEGKNFCSYRELSFGYPAHSLITILTYSGSCFELDSSVGTMMGYELDVRKIGVRFLARTRKFFLLHSIQIGPTQLPNLGLFPRG